MPVLAGHGVLRVGLGSARDYFGTAEVKDIGETPYPYYKRQQRKKYCQNVRKSYAQSL
jgi:hypothetical protein